MNNSKKLLSVLSTAAVSAIIASVISTPASAKMASVVLKDASGKLYEYNYQALTDSFVNGTKLYDDFKALKDSGAQVLSYYDDVQNEFVSRSTLIDAYLNDTTGTFNAKTATETLPTTAVDGTIYEKVENPDGTVSEQPKQGTADVEVSSVSAINATTVQVTVPAALATAPTVSDFTVLVDGAAVTPTAVVKAPNETVKYNLTIPTLANKEGSLTVNGVAATITGSDFGYDFKAPEVASVVGVDNRHVKVTFSEKIDKTKAQDVTLYNITGLDNKDLDETAAPIPAAKLQPSSAALLSDGKSVLLTLNTTADFATFKSGYILTVLTGMQDVKTNATTAAIKTIFDGVGTVSTSAPVALTATDNATVGSRTLTVNFDKAIASPDKTKITVGGQALTLNDTVSATGTALTINLSTATAAAYDKAADKSIAFAAGAVKDTATPANDIAASTVSVTQAAYLTSATYDEASNKLVLNFSNKVNADTFDTSKVQVNGKALVNDRTKVTVAETGYTNTLTLDITKTDGSSATVADIEGVADTARNVIITTDPANKDVNGSQVSGGTYTTNFTYTDDTTASKLVSTSYNTTTKKLILTFDEDVKSVAENLANVEVWGDGAKLFDLKNDVPTSSTLKTLTVPANSTDKQLAIQLGSATSTDGAAVAAGLIEGVKDPSTLKVVIDKTTTGNAPLTDYAGNEIAQDAAQTVAISYTDQNKFKISSASQTGLAADQVKVVFNKALDANDIKDITKYVVAKSDNTAVTLPVIAAQPITANGIANSGVILQLDKNSANYVNGYKYTVTTTAKDSFGNEFDAAASAGDFTLNTATPVSAFKLSSAAYADTNKDYTVNAGDQITLTFDGAVSLSGDVTADDFTGTANLGTGFTVAQGSAPEQLVVTLGQGADVIGKTLDLNSDPTKIHIKGANGVTVNQKGSAITLVTPTIDTAYVTKAVYNDLNGDGTMDTGDSLTLTFNEGIKTVSGKTIDAAAAATANIDFVTGSGETLTLDNSAESIDGSTLTIGIKNGTNIVPGTTTIDVDPTNNDGLTDLWGNKLGANPSAPVVIEKSDKVAPTFSNVSIVKKTGNTGSKLEVGDKVVFNVSEAVNKTGLNLNSLVLYAGATPIVYGVDNHTLFGDSSTATEANTSAVVIDNVAKTVTVTVAANDGWAGAAINSISTFNIDGFKVSFSDANGNTITPASGFGLAVTK